jgi:hypothetical protein
MRTIVFSYHDAPINHELKLLTILIIPANISILVFRVM